MSGTRGPLCGLSGREWSSLSSSVQKKLDNFIGKMTKEHDERASKAEREFKESSAQLRKKLNESEIALKSVDEQLTAANVCLVESKTSLKSLEGECDELRKQRNLAVDERHRLQTNIQKQNNQIALLQSDVAELSEHLNKAVESKCEALSKYDDLQNKASSLEQRERRMDQERLLLGNQIQNLTDDLNRYNAELQTVRSECDSKLQTAEAKILERDAKLETAAQKLKELGELASRLSVEKERLSEKLLSHSEAENEALDHCKKEVTAKAKLIDMYVGIIDEHKEKIVQLDANATALKSSEAAAQTEKNVIKSEYESLRTTSAASAAEKEKIISELTGELEKLKTRLQASTEESMCLLLQNMTPAASATCSLIKTMSLTQIYDQIVKLTDDLSEMKKENGKLERSVTSLTDEVKEEKHKLKQQSASYNDIIQSVTSLKRDNEELSSKIEKVEAEKKDISKESESLRMDNNKLNGEIKDLSRQICFLLQEIQLIKNNEESSDIPASQISKAMITFKDIEELQANNLCLIKLVNELKDKLKYPRIVTDMDGGSVSNLLNKRIHDLIQTQDHQLKMIDALTSQRDRFEKLYNESLEKQAAAHNAAVEISSTSVVAKNQNDIDNLQILLSKQKEDHKKYKEEMQISENILKKELENTKKKFAELSAGYAKISSECKTAVSQAENLRNANETYKKQVFSLEERNQIYDSSIVKQDQTIKYLRDQAMESLTKLNKNEIILENLRQECKFLKDSETRLKKERDLLKKERYSQSLILNEIELIKVSGELKDGEERITFETKLESLNKELIEVKRDLKLHQDKYNEMKSSFEEEISQIQNNLKESNNIIEKKKSEISSLNEQLLKRSRTIDDLNKRVLNLIAMSSQEDTPEVVRKVKDLENQLINSQNQIDILQQQLLESKDYGTEYHDKFVNIDEEYKKLESSFAELKQTFDIKTQEMLNAEQTMKDKISKMEMKLSFQSRDLNLLDSNELKVELSKTMNMVETLTHDLEERNIQLQDAKSQALIASQAAQKSEDKYAHEMMLHSSDIQMLRSLKKQLTELKHENESLLSAKKNFEAEIVQLKNQWSAKEKQIVTDGEQMRQVVENIKKQNAILHDQLQTFNSSNVDSANSSNLLNIIEYLKRENEISITKIEIVNAQSERLKSEIEILNKKLSDAKITIESTSKKEESNIHNASDILSDNEKFDALTDSNVLLRTERDNLLKCVTQLTETTSNYESMIKMTQATNDELKTKFDLVQTENSNLKTEITRWRSRVGTLVEKANKQSPEDWKRLQNERETLAKKLTVEKENNRKLLQEISVLQTVKSDIEEQMNTFNLKFTSLTDEYNKQSNELTLVKNDVSRLTQELLEAKTSILNESEINKQVGEKLAKAENTLAEVIKREGLIKKIANKYKTQYFALVKTNEEQNAASSTDPTVSNPDEKLITELKEKISQSDEKCVSFEKEIGSLRDNLTDHESIKLQLEESKTNINHLTEINETLTKELEGLKVLVESSQKNNLEMETRLSEVRSRYEEQISQSERLHSTQERTKNSEIVQLNRKVEYLMKKIKGGTTTLSPKPSTSYSQENSSVSEVANIQSLIGTITSDISSYPSSSQNVTENLPSSSSTMPHIMPQFHKSSLLPPESTQDVESNTPRDDESPKQASSSSNNNSSNSAVTTSHSNDNLETSQRIGKRSRLSADQTNEETTGKRMKMLVTTESEFEYQVPTSSQRDQEDECVILIDSGDEDNQCGNSCQEDIEEDEEDKVVEGAQVEHQSEEISENASLVTIESNEVDIDLQRSPNAPQLQRDITNSNEVNTDQSPPVSHTTEQQIETISSVTEGGEGGSGYLSLGVGSAGVSGTYDDGNDSIVPSTPVLYMPRSSDGFGEAINSPATESAGEGCFSFVENRAQSNDATIEDTHADLTPQIEPNDPITPEESKESSEADTENFQQDEDSPLVSSQGSRASTPQIEEGSEAEASSTDIPSNSQRGGWRRGQGQRPQSSMYRVDYNLRQPQRFRNGRPGRRPYRR